MHRSRAFGLRWDSDVVLDQFEAAAPDGTGADITVTRAPGALRPRTVSYASLWGEICEDGVRFNADEEITYDIIGPSRIEWASLTNSKGNVPAIFFSTVTALMLAWRGAIPMHGTAVEIDGKGILICGAAGVGKSTLAAGLIALGARFISDDLSVLHPSPGNAAPVLYAGRPAMRLFPATAAFLKASRIAGEFHPVPNGKHIVLPPRVDPLAPIPLAAMIILGKDDPVQDDVRPQAHLFRPKWMEILPGREDRATKLASAACHVKIVTFCRLGPPDAAGFMKNAVAARERISAAIG